MYQIIARLLLIVTVLGLAPIPQAASGSRLQQAEFAVNISANRTSNWSWTLGPEQVIFSYRGDCTSGPVIWRTPLSGGTVRALIERAPVGACDAYEIRSNIVSDGGYLYWMDATGLVRMPIAGGELPVQRAASSTRIASIVPPSSRYQTRTISAVTWCSAR